MNSVKNYVENDDPYNSRNYERLPNEREVAIRNG